MTQNTIPISRGERFVGWLSNKQQQLENSLIVAAERQSQPMTKGQKIFYGSIFFVTLGVPAAICGLSYL